jgi:S1-C subfamily serine protease
MRPIWWTARSVRDQTKTLLAPILLHASVNVLGVTAMMVDIAATAASPVLGVRVTAREGGCLPTEVVPGGTAAATDLRVGDVITAVGGEPVADLRGLLRVVRARHVGDKVAVDYTRGGEAHRVEALLRGRPK